MGAAGQAIPFLGPRFPHLQLGHLQVEPRHSASLPQLPQIFARLRPAEDRIWGVNAPEPTAPLFSLHPTWSMLIWQRNKQFHFMSLQTSGLPASQPPSWPDARPDMQANIATQTCCPGCSEFWCV